MNQQTISVEKGTFKSPLLPIVAFLFAVAAICGALAVGYLFHPVSIPAIIHDMELGQIYDTTAQQTWLVIYIAVTVVNFLGTLVLSSGISLTLLGRHYHGTDLMYHSAKWALVAVNISGAAAVPYAIFRAVRYIIVTITYYGISDGLVPLYSMVIVEGLMLSLSWFQFVKLRQFLNCLMDATASIGYTLASGILKAPSIPGFSASGFLVLGLFDAVIAMDRFFTFIHRQINYVDHFYFPLTRDPVQFLSGLSFAFASLGSLLLYLYLRSYKSKSERLLIRAFKAAIE